MRCERRLVNSPSEATTSSEPILRPQADECAGTFSSGDCRRRQDLQGTETTVLFLAQSVPVHSTDAARVLCALRAGAFETRLDLLLQLCGALAQPSVCLRTRDMGLSEFIVSATTWPGFLLGVTSSAFVLWSIASLTKQMTEFSQLPVLDTRLAGVC